MVLVVLCNTEVALRPRTRNSDRDCWIKHPLGHPHSCITLLGTRAAHIFEFSEGQGLHACRHGLHVLEMSDDDESGTFISSNDVGTLRSAEFSKRFEKKFVDAIMMGNPTLYTSEKS